MIQISTCVIFRHPIPCESSDYQAAQSNFNTLSLVACVARELTHVTVVAV
jgi:hypothetical protein